MNLVSTIAIAEHQHAALISEADALDGRVSAMKAAADSKRKRARSIQSLLSRCKGTLDAIQRTEPEILADLGIDLSADAPPIPAPPGLDGEPATVVEGAAPRPINDAPDGPTEARPADDDRDADDDPGEDAGAVGDGVAADPAVGDEVGAQAETAPEPPVRRVPRFEPKPAPEPVTGTVAERVLAVLQERRHGRTVAIDWTELADLTGTSIPRVRTAVDRLCQSAQLRRVTSKVQGQLSAIIKNVQAEAAA